MAKEFGKQTFGESSQARHWTFTAKQLAEARQAANEDAAEKLRASPSASSSTDLRPLATDEEALLRRYWENKLQETCQRECAADPSHFTDRLMSAAHFFFKRFFLKRSVMSEDPKAVLLAALYLAGKVEEERVDRGQLLLTFFPKKNFSESDLGALEMTLLQTLRFQLVTTSPLRCLTGLMHGLQGALTGAAAAAAVPAETSALLLRLHEQSATTVRAAMCTDAPLLFAPQQIALEALTAAVSELATGDDSAAAEARRWVGGVGGGGPKLEAQIAAVRACREGSTFDLEAAETMALLKGIDTRLKAVRRHVKAVAGAREEEAARVDAATAAKRKAGKAEVRAEQQRELAEKLATALGEQAVGAATEGGSFTIKRRRKEGSAAGEASVKQEP